MKTPSLFKNVIMAFALICLSTNAQTSKKPVTSQYAPIVQKLSQDLVLSDQQKDIIRAKTDSIFQKHQNKKMGMKDTMFMKDMNTVRKDILDNVLTSDQKQILKQKKENMISRYQTSNR
ncbi:MAG: hypothetical protein NTY32_02785 [Bacteroidia bacterium]|nr:hypothetical protein [Bacteroidia bacterium]